MIHGMCVHLMQFSRVHLLRQPIVASIELKVNGGVPKISVVRQRVFC